MNQQKSSGKKKKSQISDSRGSGVEIAQPGVCLCVCSWGHTCPGGCASGASTQARSLFAWAVAVQFLCSATHVLSAKKWRVVCASHTPLLPAFQDCSPIQAVFSCHIITLVFFTLLLQDLGILLSPSFSRCLNPFLARPEAPFPCHANFSRQGDVFPCHHVLHFLQLPWCFLQGILLHPLPDLACWKWPCWVWCESFFHLSFTL